MRRHPPPEIEDVSEPFCGIRRKNMVPLLDADPIVASEWSYDRNCGFGPEDFSHASSVKAWWECPFCERPYKASINNRTGNQSACPYCASKLVSSDNALSIRFPEIAKEWHPKKNGKLKPSQVMYASGKEAWWICADEHEWKARISDRTGHRSGCPTCYEARMEYAREHPKPRQKKLVVLGKNKPISRVWYEAGRIKFVPLSKSHPRIAKQWHPEANGEWKPSDFARGSDAIVWWKCSKGSDHEWQSSIWSRTSKERSGCPFCSGQRVSKTNSLSALNPQLSKQWHPKLNGKLQPSDVTTGSRKKAWWVCVRDKDHIWETSIYSRSVGSGCPFCLNRRASKTNNLKAVFPYIAAQWHPKRNGALKPDEVLPISSKAVWWICSKEKNHEWQATIANRTHNGSGCPFCAGRKASKTNSLAALFPHIAKQWHKTKNAELYPTDVTAGTNKLVWWQCERGHVWNQTVHARTKRNSGCPKCKKREI